MITSILFDSRTLWCLEISFSFKCGHLIFFPDESLFKNWVSFLPFCLLFCPSFPPSSLFQLDFFRLKQHTVTQINLHIKKEKENFCWMDLG